MMEKTKYKLEEQPENTSIGNFEIIEVPQNISVFTDKKTNAKSVAFPITFPNGTNGVIIISHLDTMPWVPSKEIEKIIIKFK